MRELQKHLAHRAASYATSPLFPFLADQRLEPAVRIRFVPYLAHFAMTFADLYALVLRQEPPDDRFQELVNAHTYEDGGHWKWYLADLSALEFDPMVRYSDALRSTWGPQTTEIRMLSYRICRLGLGATSLQKLVLVQCIEAAGKVSLTAAAPLGKELQDQHGKKLVYFGPHHLETEAEHTLEDESLSSWLDEIELEGEQRDALRLVVNEAFDAFDAFASELFSLVHEGVNR